jgi:hypothetical protein
MAWLWTDELARLLIEEDGVDADLLIGWTDRPVAVRSDESDELAAARNLFGRAEEVDAA